MAEETWQVGIAECKITQSPIRLLAYGLGSCVGVLIYDRTKKMGGLAHVMLPSSRLHSPVNLPGKYADTAVEFLVEELEKAGCRKAGLISKIVGGANMFSAIFQTAIPIGLRNV